MFIIDRYTVWGWYLISLCQVFHPIFRIAPPLCRPLSLTGGREQGNSQAAVTDPFPRLMSARLTRAASVLPGPGQVQGTGTGLLGVIERINRDVIIWRASAFMPSLVV